MSTFQSKTVEEWNDALDDYWRRYYPDQPLIPQEKLTESQLARIETSGVVRFTAGMDRLPSASILLTGDILQEHEMFGLDESGPTNIRLNVRRMVEAKQIMIDGIGLFTTIEMSADAADYAVTLSLHQSEHDERFFLELHALHAKLGLT